MRPEGVRDTIEVLLAADPDVADRDEVAALVRESRRLRSWLDAVDVRCARRTRALAAEGRAEPAESLLGDEGRRPSKEAAAVSDRDKVCESMPGFEESLASGTVSAGHLDAIANATRRLDDEVRDDFHNYEQQLLAAAEQQRIDQFERTCRDLARHLAATHDSRSETDELERQQKASKIKRWVDKQTGMHHTHVELDPLRDAMLKAALDAHLRRVRTRDGKSGRPWSELEIEAFMQAITSGVTRTGDAKPGDHVTAVDDPPAHQRVPRITVHLDYDKLVGAAVEHGLCETSGGIPLPATTVRRLCCDAEIIPVVLNGRSQALDVGRASRTVTPAQREALRAMHRTCGNPECHVPFDDCVVHHIEHWVEHGGATDLANLVPLCSRHHTQLHEGGWTLTMTPERVAAWTRPDGTTHWTGSIIDRIPEPGTTTLRPAAA